MRGRKPLLIFLIVPLLLLFSGCGGGGSGSSYNPPGEPQGVPFVLTLTPSQTIAQTNSSIILSAKVLDGNGVPVPNLQVTFTNLSEPFGVIKTALAKLRIIKAVGILSATVANTNSLGIARVTLSSTTTGFATVQAEISNSVGVSRAKKTVFFALSLEPQATPPLTIDLSIQGGDNTLFKTPNDNQRIIVAEVLQGSSPVPTGTNVTFGADFPYRTSVGGTCSDGSTTCSVTFPNGNVAMTDASGMASTLVQVDPAGFTNIQSVLNITASATVNSQSASNLISLFLSPVTISSTNSSLSASPTVLPANQTTTTSTITAGVALTSGGPVFDGTTVNFSATCGSLAPFAQTTGGIATATFTAPATVPSGGICTVSASAAGVSIGSVNITITAPLVPLSVQPGTQSISGVAGGTAVFTIFGGVAGYTVTSPNPAIAFNVTKGNGIWNVTNSGGTFTVTVPPNAVTTDTNVALTVIDQAGTTVAATLTITGPNPLLITPNIASIASSGSAQTLTFNISGGVAPYITTSSDPSKAFNASGTPAAGVWDHTTSGSTPNGTPIIVTFPANVTAGAAPVTLTVFDSLGNTASASITIIAPPAAALHISPNIVSVVSSGSSQTLTFTISGGTAPYVTTSSDPSKGFNASGTPASGIWDHTTSGSGPNGTPITVTFPANVATQQTSVTLNVLDNAFNTTTATITILPSGASSVLAVTPTSVSVTGTSDTSDQVKFIISGGVTPYQGTAFSSNTAVVPNAAVSGNTFTVNPNPVFASTAVTMTVLDNTGAPASATITVTPATSSLGVNPSTIAVFQGAPITFSIIGGLGPTFRVYTSDIGVITLPGGLNPYIIPPGSSPFVGTTVGAGSATITIVDSDGNTTTSAVTVVGPPAPVVPALTVLPPSGALSCTAGGTVTFVVTGGAGPNYLATSSNPNVVIAGSPITTSGGSFTATIAAASCGLFPSASTTVPIIVTDSGSGITTVTVTVSNP